MNHDRYPMNTVIGNISVQTKSLPLARYVAEIAQEEIMTHQQTSGIVMLEGAPIAWTVISAPHAPSSRER